MITPHDILRRVCRGHLMLVGEVRAADVREAGLVDTKTGLKSTVWLITYFVELDRAGGFEIVKITRRVPPDNADPGAVPVMVEKGKCYAFEIESAERKPGFLLARLGGIVPEEVDLGEPVSGAPQARQTPAA